MVITQKEKEMTAYHEAGHALVVMLTPGTNPLHKVTIMPRGAALGMTMHLPEMDKYSKGMNEYQAQIDVCLGGKVAEELIYGPDRVTSGVQSVSLLRFSFSLGVLRNANPFLGPPTSNSSCLRHGDYVRDV
jgi:ATP-dependent metalloprotease